MLRVLSEVVLVVEVVVVVRTGSLMICVSVVVVPVVESTIGWRRSVSPVDTTGVSVVLVSVVVVLRSVGEIVGDTTITSRVKVVGMRTGVNAAATGAVRAGAEARRGRATGSSPLAGTAPRL